MASLDTLAFIDLLDIDESIIDHRLSTLFEREKYDLTQLMHIKTLLQYKNLINVAEEDYCDNENEYKFICKLIPEVCDENIEVVCNITKLVLKLDEGSKISKAQHLLHQILPDVIQECSESKSFLRLKLCDSILHVISENLDTIPLYGIEIELNKILESQNENVVKHFLIYTVPKMVIAVSGLAILDIIWDHIVKLKAKNLIKALKMLASLVDYYFPRKDEEMNIKSNLIENSPFWNLLLQGLYSSIADERKVALYLLQRSVNYINENKNVSSKNSNIGGHFNWKDNKNYINNFITLFECLEEKQANIVLPAIYILDEIKEMDRVWLNCIFKLGLNHESKQVKLKFIEERLKGSVNNTLEAEILLDAINNMNLFSCPKEVDELIDIYKKLEDESLFTLAVSITSVNWASVPFHYIVNTTIDCIMERVNTKNSLFLNRKFLYQLLTDISKITCNNPQIKLNINNKAAKLFIELCKDNNWRHLKYMKINCDPLSLLSGPERSMFDAKDINVDNEAEFVDWLMLSPLHICLSHRVLEFNDTWRKHLLKNILQKIDKIKAMIAESFNNKLTEQCYEWIYFLCNCCEYNSLASQISQSTVEKMNDIPLSYLPEIRDTIRDHLSIFRDYICYLCACQNSNFPYCNEYIKAFKTILNFIVQNHLSGCYELGPIKDMYKKSVQIVSGLSIDIKSKILNLMVLNHLHQIIVKENISEVIEVVSILKIGTDQIEFTKISRNEEPLGKLRNSFNYEYWCLVSKYFNHNKSDENIGYTADLPIHFDKSTFLFEGLESSDNNTLKYIIVVTISLFEHFDLVPDTELYLNTLWRRISDMKSQSNQLTECLQSFTSLLFLGNILRNSCYNNMVIDYFKKLLEISHTLDSYNLLNCVKDVRAEDIDVTILSEMIVELLLFSPYQRKDEIMLERILKSLNPVDYSRKTAPKQEQFTDYEQQMYKILKLYVKQNSEVLRNVQKLTMARVDRTLSNKKRYHESSQVHRFLFNSLRVLLMVACLENNTIDQSTLVWCVNLLCRLPHQPDVKVCLEWYIALYICKEDLPLNENTSSLSLLERLPTISKCLVLYHVLKHRLLLKNHEIYLNHNEHCTLQSDYNYVMETLFTNTLGPVFNLRLYSQYLALKLYQIMPNERFSYTIELVKKALAESSEEKTFKKIQNDYLINDFDLLKKLNFNFLYYFLPSLYSSDLLEDFLFGDEEFLLDNRVKHFNDGKFAKIWLVLQPNEYKVTARSISVPKYAPSFSIAVNEQDFSGVIQKKYIPGQSVCDVDIYKAEERKKGSQSELIVVASLVDKLPNLGGMARTGEVFGVKTLVIDSLRHLQDRNFQGLSMSAERWVDIEEVRPGQALKEYLLTKKNYGFSIVAAEQTSSSIKLQSFQFPRKCLLLMGHEKNGVPCDLLPYMDYCVEIPQQGYVRSLNVHVTAAIFVWEYTRQHLLTPVKTQ